MKFIYKKTKKVLTVIYKVCIIIRVIKRSRIRSHLTALS